MSTTTEAPAKRKGPRRITAADVERIRAWGGPDAILAMHIHLPKRVIAAVREEFNILPPPPP